MNDENVKWGIPADEPSVGKATLVGAILGPLFFGLITGTALLLTKIPGLKPGKFLLSRKTRIMEDQTIGNYVGSAFAGGLLGNLIGGYEKEKFGLSRENAKLKNEVIDLKTDKSFTRALVEEKKEAAQKSETSVRS